MITKSYPLKGVVSSLTLALCAFGTQAAIPSGYYDSVNQNNAQTLRSTLHAIIDDHKRFPYTSSNTDTWDILEQADQDPDNASNVIDIYKNASYPKVGGGNSNYNREHSWPKSYGFPSDGSSNYPYTDAHHLFIANSSYNSSRSNKPYANCDSSCSSKPTELNNNRGGGAGDNNLTTGSFSTGTWQTWNGRKGDVARALMYMDVRYAGGTHGVTGVSEPDLILTDDRTLIANSKQGSNISVAYMGLKSVLIQWHKDDPVDDFERRHNNAVHSHQQNRNPFVDHPEYVACVFENSCSGGGGGDTTPPATPSNLSATGGNSLIALAWSANTESDLSGYNLYRSSSLNGSYTKVNSGVINTSAYDNTGLTANTTFFYKVSAVDSSGNESTHSSAVSATTNSTPPPTGAQVWINEIHYDNNGSDTGEMVEVAGTAGTNLTGWSIVAYNGNGGASYKTTSISGTITDAGQGFGVISTSISGLQNGGPDGIALVNASNAVVQFLSYEGAFTATNGPANGTTSVNIGVAESGSTPAGHSLQLSGSGAQYSDFRWQAAAANTAGNVNTGQTFTGSGNNNQDPVANFTFTCSGLTCQFDGSSSSDSDGSITGYQWNFGGNNNASNSTTSFSFAQTGTYTVLLTVTDNNAATHSVSKSVQVTAAQQALFENTQTVAIPDFDTINSNIAVQRTGTSASVEVKVNITHTYRGDISLVLTAPDGSSYNLKNYNGGDSGQNVIQTFNVSTTGPATGTWRLRVRDHYRQDTGSLNNWSIKF